MLIGRDVRLERDRRVLPIGKDKRLEAVVQLPEGRRCDTLAELNAWLHRPGDPAQEAVRHQPAHQPFVLRDDTIANEVQQRGPMYGAAGGPGADGEESDESSQGLLAERYPDGAGDGGGAAAAAAGPTHGGATESGGDTPDATVEAVRAGVGLELAQ
eukprot:gene44598-39708_t